MRISTNTLYDLGVGSIQQQTSALIKTQQQVSSGRRILTPQDDPVGAARVLEVSQSVSLNKQYDVNTNSATSSLGLEEGKLASIGSLIQDVRTIAVNAGNPTLDRNNLASLATDLRGRYQELLGLANTNDGNGQYLFSGYQGATTPFAETSPGVVKYNGDEGQRLMQISTSRQIAVSDAGSDVFMQIKNGNGTFVTAVGGNPGVPSTTPNLGTGIVSAGTVLDQAKWLDVTDKNLTIKFSVTGTPPATTYDIVDSTNTSILPAPRAFTSGSTISLSGLVSPPASSTDYGIELSIEGSPATGDTFTIKPSTNESIFTTLNNLITSLETGSGTGLTNSLNTALTNLDNDLNKVLTVRASVGARMKEIDSVKSAGEDTALQYQQTLSGLQDVDYAKAISDLTRQQSGLEAAQKSFLKVQGLSLFNYI